MPLKGYVCFNAKTVASIISQQFWVRNQFIALIAAKSQRVLFSHPLNLTMLYQIENSTMKSSSPKYNRASALVNPLSPKGDQHQFSPNYIKTSSIEKVRRINKMMNTNEML